MALKRGLSMNRVFTYEDKCTGCNKCIEACPVDCANEAYLSSDGKRARALQRDLQEIAGKDRARAYQSPQLPRRGFRGYGGGHRPRVQPTGRPEGKYLRDESRDLGPADRVAEARLPVSARISGAAADGEAGADGGGHPELRRGLQPGAGYDEERRAGRHPRRTIS